MLTCCVLLIRLSAAVTGASSALTLSFSIPSLLVANSHVPSRPANNDKKKKKNDGGGADATAVTTTTVLAIYKPRGVLSAVGVDKVVTGRRTLTDLMIAANYVEPLLQGHIGRLDLETSGLILVTDDGLLLEAALGMPTATTESSMQAVSLPKVYRLLLAGRHEADAEAIASLCDPLVFCRGGNEYHADGATVRHERCFRNATLATEYTLIDCDDSANEMEEKRDAIRAKHTPATVRSRKTGEWIKPYVPFDGWLTQVEITISQGRHHQIRRLCKRAGLPLRHLQRVAFGPIELEDMTPGQVRSLTVEELDQLYQACLPHMEVNEARRRRSQAMEVARSSRRR